MVFSLCVVSLLALWAVVKGFFLQREISKKNAELEEFKLKLDERIARERAEAVKKSRAVIKGQISENVYCFQDAFPYKASDCKALYQPIDIICFSGLSDSDVQEIIFADIKTGEAQLSKIQRQIKNCIENNKVRFETWR